MRKSSRFTQSLPCPLTPEEFETKSKGLADLCKEINHAKDKAKEEAKQNKEAIDKMETTRTLLSTIVRDKEESREIECEEKYNYRLHQVESIRLDTGEVFGTRAMELSEYQAEMDLHAKVVPLKSAEA